ncbi:SGNH/GDSL hydrolase family protein [Lysinibacter sp. HNR]|uniref:SGNH/GDSL hydrolase family protein n=1 Tax=Lysinibacter sp. HNR TaxID=3031408 RepID=UPI0024352193|nr:SGNH/GDSL hydrolase family protein [Lysinibacter sp. HNR]WGD38639.1 SGNH/GDSL hydrolase family protein [Lysinibacter sp. HNR]
MQEIKYVALGDSFTEGVGDELSNGYVRGWADLVAEGFAQASSEAVYYANLAIRGKLLRVIIDEQLDRALALSPTLVTFNGGGNDMLRPRTHAAELIALFQTVIERVSESGAQLVLLSGGNPTRGLPLGGSIERKGDLLNNEVRRIAAKNAIPFVDNWTDHELSAAQYWSPDRLHLNSVGHHRVASRVLQALHYPAPSDWQVRAERPNPRPGFRENAVYYRDHVVPWVQRRLTGKSSGDGRQAKIAEWKRISGAR